MNVGYGIFYCAEMKLGLQLNSKLWLLSDLRMTYKYYHKSKKPNHKQTFLQHKRLRCVCVCVCMCVRAIESYLNMLFLLSQDHIHYCGVTEAVIRLALSALVGVAAVAVLVYDIRSRSVQQKREQTSSSSD